MADDLVCRNTSRVTMAEVRRFSSAKFLAAECNEGSLYTMTSNRNSTGSLDAVYRPACGERTEVRGHCSYLFRTGLLTTISFVNRARVFRKKATHTERILWRHLRNRNFAGYKFLVSIPSSVIYWISIIRQQSSQLNWMVAGIAIVWVKFAIENGRSCRNPYLNPLPR
jgi:hypothetical protein